MEINIERQDKTTYVNVDGALYMATITDFELKWDEITKDEPDVIAINCANIEFIDSSALGILVHYLKVLKEQNRNLVFYNLSDAVHNVFRLTKLDKFFKITTEEELQRLIENKSINIS